MAARLVLPAFLACGTPGRAAPLDAPPDTPPDAAVDATLFGVLIGSEPTPALPDVRVQMRGHHDATITVGEVRVDGKADRAIVRRYMRRHRNELLVCYLVRLGVAPNLRPGPLAVHYTIVARGAITDASVIGFDPHVSDCIAQRLEQIELPKLQGDARVAMTFTVEIE
jgi:hypothetical protein